MSLIWVHREKLRQTLSLETIRLNIFPDKFWVEFLLYSQKYSLVKDINIFEDGIVFRTTFQKSVLPQTPPRHTGEGFAFPLVTSGMKMWYVF